MYYLKKIFYFGTVSKDIHPEGRLISLLLILVGNVYIKFSAALRSFDTGGLQPAKNLGWVPHS